LTASWYVLRLVVPEAVDDEIAAVLGEGSLGVEVAHAGAGESEVRVYLDSASAAASWSERAARVLEAHGLATGPARVSAAPVPDGRWVERWQATLAPIPLGERFVVVPDGRATNGSGRVPIRLVPGMAFGTGEHETTRLCAAALERCVAPGSHWLDLGTGTGILAVVAARCGAAHVLAVDTDPEAARVAAEVVRANEAQQVVVVRAGSAETRGTETFDGAVANIQSSYFLGHAPDIAHALKPHGALVASGLLDEDVAEVSGALAASGLLVETITADGPWVCAVARRRAP
jgi:ribosomal protein L11 methyltransferase